MMIMMMMTAHSDGHRVIRVRGAREHNLRNISVDIPRDQLVVVTGLSGSGKSSLAFDTIFAEGQRKYMESLSAYARQFLDQLQKPDMDNIEGLPPTIAIEQRSSGHNPRSTVATTTEIYDYLRLLYARCGTPRCWSVVNKRAKKRDQKFCNHKIERQSASQIIDAIMARPEGTRLMLLAPAVRGKKGFHREVLEELQREGFVRARVNGTVHDLREVLKEGDENPLKLGRYEMHNIEAVVDRIVIRADVRGRLADSVETALRIGQGVLFVSEQPAGEENREASWTDTVYSEHFACPIHPECSLEELEPRLFSFNSPFGACGKCLGLGTVQEFDLDLIVEDPTRTMAEGAVSAFARIGHAYRSWFNNVLKRTCKRFGIDLHTPWEALSDRQRHILLHGATKKDVDEFGHAFRGVIPILHERYEKTDTERVKERISALMSQSPCPECNGNRLREEALHVYLHSAEFGELHIAEVTELNVAAAVNFFAHLELDEERSHIAAPILREIRNRLGFLRSVGLGYLNLNRRTGTLSGGEAQRIRLATQVGTGLVGVCYVLDEPTIGLHQRDNDRLIKTLRHLSDIGNTVIVVEHDEDMIRAADHILDIGPGPGVHGGQVVAQGTVDDIVGNPNSLTGKFLSGIETIPLPHDRRDIWLREPVVVKGASENNLRNIDVSFPLGGLICVTGVSGSGKSTLVNEILLHGLRRHLHGSREKPGAHKRITGLEQVDRVVAVDQSPIGRTPRSNPATYTGVMDDIRALFARTKEARIRGYTPGRFSFNVKGGRCESCQGQGTKKIEMHFLPDVYVECEVCHGTRYNRETLEVTYRHRNIADVLKMTVEDAIGFFAAHPRILSMLVCLRDVGLEYIELGQPSTTLSGGEAQRVKLATELGKYLGAFASAAAAADAEAKANAATGSRTASGADGTDDADHTEDDLAADAEINARDDADADAGADAHADEDDARDDEIDDIRSVRRAGSAAASGRGGGRFGAGSRQHTVYILDEPTTGLHFADIRKLLSVLNTLADQGNTLVVIEHNLDVIKCADWIIDLGPEGGAGGGTVVAEGEPEAIVRAGIGHTAAYLRKHLELEATRSGSGRVSDRPSESAETAAPPAVATTPAGSGRRQPRAKAARSST